jgi:type II secretory ATPase GspE/PulE/Tfp pilus assembly ATPase PilB-like protein
MEYNSGNKQIHIPDLSCIPKDLAYCATDTALDLISEADSFKNGVLPIGVFEVNGKTTLMVAASTNSIETYKIIKFLAPNYEPYIICIGADTIKEATFIAYNRKSKKLEKLLSNAIDTSKTSFEPKIQEPKVKTCETELLDGLLDYSIAWNASDLHIMPHKEGLAISIRINGKIHSRDTVVRGGTMYQRVLQRIKILSKLDITQRELPQDGAFEIPLDHGAVSARVSIVPSVFGESLSIRFFKHDDTLYIRDLGFDSELEKKLFHFSKLSSGALLVCGATGAGKTTTLYAIARELVRNGKRVISLEDPVEKIINGMNQIQVSENKKITFETGLKAIFRQDPDVIIVGELRDQFVAQTLIQASLSGHLVISTIHAGSIEEAKLRLIDWGITKEQFKYGIKFMLHQHLDQTESDEFIIKTSFFEQ